jgi:alkylation response protein AidB-like acyl-CoA dehydrogenase
LGGCWSSTAGGLDYFGYTIVSRLGAPTGRPNGGVGASSARLWIGGALGTEEQKQAWLPRLCSGEALGCFGLTEPDTGSDAANLRTLAKKIDGGWSISGQKMWISLANYAELALIFAQTDPEQKHRGLACFLVPTSSDGFSEREAPTRSLPVSRHTGTS